MRRSAGPLLALLLAAPAAAQELAISPPARGEAPAEPSEASASEASAGGSAATAPGGVLRVLDKLDGTVTDLDLRSGETGEVGRITVTMGECRFPSDNPAGDAFALVSVRTAEDETAIFEGWLIASAPALNAVDHPRYDVWALRCSGT